MNLTAIMKRSDGSFLVKSVSGQQIPMKMLQLEELLGYEEARLQTKIAEGRIEHWHSLGSSRKQETVVKKGDAGDWNSLGGDEV